MGGIGDRRRRRLAMPPATSIGSRPRDRRRLHHSGADGDARHRAAPALVGLVDDWIKVRQPAQPRASTSGPRSLGQLVVGRRLRRRSRCTGRGRHPPVVHPLELAGARTWAASGGRSWPCSCIIGSTNAVNLTDGLDGLAAGSSAFAFSAFAVIGYWQFRHFGLYHVPQPRPRPGPHRRGDGRRPAPASCGGTPRPAQIFMGDTGSLAIGAALAGLCLVENVDLLLPVIGGLFVLETLSVVIQVASFRLFHRRVFRMAPIHHHFELRRLAGDDGDRAVLDPGRRCARPWPSGSSTPTSSPSGGGRLMAGPAPRPAPVRSWSAWRHRRGRGPALLRRGHARGRRRRPPPTRPRAPGRRASASSSSRRRRPRRWPSPGGRRRAGGAEPRRARPATRCSRSATRRRPVVERDRAGGAGWAERSRWWPSPAPTARRR